MNTLIPFKRTTGETTEPTPPSTKIITAANKQMNYKLMRAASYREYNVEDVYFNTLK